MLVWSWVVLVLAREGFPYGDEVHSNAIDAVPVMRDCFAIVVVGLRERRHRCFVFAEIVWSGNCWKWCVSYAVSCLTET